MGTSDANDTAAHVAEPSPSPSTTAPTPTPGSSSDVAVSSVVALLIDAQDKLERQRQLRWSKLTKSQNSRAEYTHFINTALKDVEEQAKRRNRVQLASFLRHEGRTREAGHGRIEEALAALELRWQKAHDALAASLGNILLEARHEEQEWNEMLRRLGAEEQARLADELPVMLRTALDAWKTEDQAEESWRNAWETTNLTLERLSQRIQQQQQPLPSSSSLLSQPQQSPRRRRRNSSESTADDVSSNADSQVALERRRSTVAQTRRMTVTRRQIEASATSSSSSSLLSSLSSMSPSEILKTAIMDPEDDTRLHARSAREYMYSPIKNQMPGQELFDESLERISPDPNMKRGIDVDVDNNPNSSTSDDVDLTFTSAAGSSTSRSMPSGTRARSSSSLHPFSTPTRSRSTKSKININTDANNEEKQNIDSGAREHDSPTRRVEPPSPQSQPQQTQPRRTTSMKRVSSNTSMKTTASTSSKTKATGSGAKDAVPKSPVKKSTAASRTATAKPPRSQSQSHSPSASTDNDGTTATSRKSKEGVSPRSTSTSMPTQTQTPSTPSSSSTPSSAWTDYDTRWRNLKSCPSLTFSSIPWPVASPTFITDIEGINPQLVAEFILSPTSSSSSEQQPVSPPTTSNGASSSISTTTATKKRIRAALLRWHPDRFNATILKNVVKSDRKAVQDGVGKVVRILNDMLAKEGGSG